MDARRSSEYGRRAPRLWKNICRTANSRWCYLRCLECLTAFWGWGHKPLAVKSAEFICFCIRMFRGGISYRETMPELNQGKGVVGVGIHMSYRIW
jgi:hypothetical protein